MDKWRRTAESRPDNKSGVPHFPNAILPHPPQTAGSLRPDRLLFCSSQSLSCRKVRHLRVARRIDNRLGRTEIASEITTDDAKHRAMACATNMCDVGLTCTFISIFLVLRLPLVYPNFALAASHFARTNTFSVKQPFFTREKNHSPYCTKLTRTDAADMEQIF